jgi:hypothetical protein
MRSAKGKRSIEGGRSVRRRFVLIAVFACVLLIPAASAQAFVANLKAPGHHPRAGKAWVITVQAHRSNGKPVRASAFYQFIFNGQVVATRYPSPHGPARHKPWKFTGSYRDPIHWPKRAVGVRLTFRVVVHQLHGGTKHLDYKVQVRK